MLSVNCSLFFIVFTVDCSLILSQRFRRNRNIPIILKTLVSAEVNRHEPGCLVKAVYRHARDVIANIRRGMSRSSKTRTCDFVLPRHTRYHLRYTPIRQFIVMPGTVGHYVLHQCHPLSVCSIGCCNNAIPEHTIASSGFIKEFSFSCYYILLVNTRHSRNEL